MRDQSDARAASCAGSWEAPVPSPDAAHGMLARGRVCSRGEPSRIADRTLLLLSPAGAGAGRERGRLTAGDTLPPGLATPLTNEPRLLLLAGPASPRRSRFVSSPLTPTARQVDPRGQRFGAGSSAVVLVVAFALSLSWLANLVGPGGVPSISYRER